jgi:hypothetical protein
MTARVPFAERGGAMRGLADLVTGCYPAFLFGGKVGSLLPVFYFHEVTRESFGTQLQFLADNGYSTITSDAIARWVVDGVSPGPRAVGLTFDDAWASVWTVAMPLLRRFSFRATLFAIPGRIADAPDVRPERSDGAGPRPEAPSASPFATWPELRAMHRSGVIDVQSHTLSHALIFSNDKIVDYVTPDYAGSPVLDRPVASANGEIRFVAPEALGTPLYVGRSRMSDARRFLPDAGVAERCCAHVARCGGARFFTRSGWRAELDRLARTGGSTFEDDAARIAWIEKELVEARALLQERLGTDSVRHVALPWGVAGRLARQALRATGHETAYAQQPFSRLGIGTGDDRYQLTRLNGRFLTCLPGHGRRWFLSAPTH